MKTIKYFLIGLVVFVMCGVVYAGPNDGSGGGTGGRLTSLASSFPRGGRKISFSTSKVFGPGDGSGQ